MLPEEEQALLALLAVDGGASKLGQRDSALLRIFLDERLDSPRMPDIPPGGASPGARPAANPGAHPAGNGDAFMQPGERLPRAPAALLSTAMSCLVAKLLPFLLPLQFRGNISFTLPVLHAHKVICT